jgi:predicted aminopeptidase
MKKATLPILLLAALLSNNAQAQNKAYAITGESKGTYTWTAIREIDLSNGNVVKTIYSANSAQKVNYNFLNSVNRSNLPQQASSPTANGVAATAYDAKNNRLYFSQMWSNDLRFVDLNSNEMTVVVNNDEKYSTYSFR